MNHALGIIVGIVLSLSAASACAAATLTTEQIMAQAKSATTLKNWMRVDRERLGSNNTGGQGPKDLCREMKSVGLGCSYVERIQLVGYLSAHGVDLFPCVGGTNPYTADMCGRPDWKVTENFLNYIGRPVQNQMLKESIKKNRGLFRNGDLTAANAAKWQK